MSTKIALIFVLAALSCLAVTESAAQRRNGLAARSPVELNDDNKTVEVEARQVVEDDEELELDGEPEQQQGVRVQPNQAELQANEPQNKRETVVRSSNEDARARRVVRRGSRRGPRRSRTSRRRRGGRRRGGRRTRGGPRRRSGVRRRAGRPFQG